MAKYYAVSVVGGDEPGIIAALTRGLFEMECNLADTNMSVLSQNFAMVLVVEAPPSLDRIKLEEQLKKSTNRFSLLISVGELVPRVIPRQFNSVDSDSRAHRDSVLVSIYGVDRPGIVHYVSAAIADSGANVVDLRTQSSDGGLYALSMKVDLARSQRGDELKSLLMPVARRCGVELSVQSLDEVEL